MLLVSGLYPYKEVPFYYDFSFENVYDSTNLWLFSQKILNYYLWLESATLNIGFPLGRLTVDGRWTVA